MNTTELLNDVEKSALASWRDGDRPYLLLSIYDRLRILSKGREKAALNDGVTPDYAYTDTVFLRVQKEYGYTDIQTSNGYYFSDVHGNVELLKQLIGMCEARKELNAEWIGPDDKDAIMVSGFRVVKITNEGDIIIGCTFIPFSEVMWLKEFLSPKETDVVAEEIK